MKVVKPALVLFIIAAVAAALLGYVNSVTAKPIAEAEAKAKAEIMAQVLDCEEWGETVEVSDSIITDYSVGKTGGETVGYAFSVTTKGYGSGLKLMVGICTEGNIKGLRVVDNSNETPGLGANSSKPEFYEQFTEKNGILVVTKTGASADNEIDAITGATITSNAVVNAVNTVTEYYEENLKGGSE